MRLENGMQVVLAGGCDYYTGSATSSPSFSFRATGLQVAGEGELLAQIERLRRKLHGEGLFEPQQRPAPPGPAALDRGGHRREAGKARDDVLAGLRRRGWAGRLVWGFAPVQDRRAAPRIATALRDLAAVGDVDTIVVARGGGSVMDLMAFSDETLCRTVALLPVPVIASVGHHTDRTLIDDVAAVACSTPTHAAETAVRVALRRGARRGGGGRAYAWTGSAAGPWWSARAGCREFTARPGGRADAPSRPRPPAAARDARRGAPAARGGGPGHRPAAAGAPAQGGHGARGLHRQRDPSRRRAASSARSARRAGPAREAPGRACASRWRPTTPSGRWSAATRWSRTGPATW